MQSRRFKAMGTEIELLVQAEWADEALDAAEKEFHRLEAILTRFDGLALDADPDTLPRLHSNLIDGYSRLPVRWDRITEAA